MGIGNWESNKKKDQFRKNMKRLKKYKSTYIYKKMVLKNFFVRKDYYEELL